MLKHTSYIITLILILLNIGCKEDSTSPTKDTMDPEGLGAPTLTSPLNNESFTSEDNTIQLIWTAIEDAASYQVQVSKDTALNMSGQEIEGVHDGKDEHSVIGMLKERSYFPNKIEKISDFKMSFFLNE